MGRSQVRAANSGALHSQGRDRKGAGNQRTKVVHQEPQKRPCRASNTSAGGQDTLDANSQPPADRPPISAAKPAAAIAPTPGVRPSMLSSRFEALVIPTIHKKRRGSRHSTGVSLPLPKDRGTKKRRSWNLSRAEHSVKLLVLANPQLQIH